MEKEGRRHGYQERSEEPPYALKRYSHSSVPHRTTWSKKFYYVTDMDAAFAVARKVREEAY